MTDNKTLISQYIEALSGRSKPPEEVSRWVADPSLSEHIAEVEAAFPAYEIIPEQMIAEGDLVAMRAQFRGVHKGNFAGVEPTGNSVSAGLMIIYRVAGGKVVEHWMQFDLFGLMQQLQQAPASVRA